VQEAADEDANIIFGAVVDPTLKGRVKITVIATGFGGFVSSVRPNTSTQTPVDMSHYADVARLRAEPAPMAVAPPPERVLIPRIGPARKPLFELPVAVGGGTVPVAPDNSGGSHELGDGAELAPAFDVPAFLRRQEG
jgi:hypothetical protein